MNLRIRTMMFSVSALALACTSLCYAQSVPTPVPSPSAAPSSGTSPAPSATPRLGMNWSLDGTNTVINEDTHGPGVSPPEGPGFAAGSPLSPMTPYDVFSGAPYTPGQAAAFQYVSTATLNAKSFTAAATFGAGVVSGSTTNLSYWGENLLPSYNPHLGSTALPYGIAFPTAQGQDNGSAERLSLLGASFGSADGSSIVRGGYFDLTQTEKFVFIQPLFTSVTPAIGVATAESLGDGPPSLSWWPLPEAGLPLLGADITHHSGIGTLELSDGLLPALPGNGVRMVNGSYVIDHAEGTRYALQVINVTTTGGLLSTTTMFGADAHTIPGPQGNLPFSTLGNQHQTTAGLSAAFHATPALDAQLDFAQAWYDATNVMEPGTQRPGRYYHVSLSHKKARTTTAVELFRFEPRYATAILPYGTPENVWSVAWSWPGQWLKSNYQLVDNSALGANRQGFRIHYRLDPGNGPFQYRVSYARYEQIQPATFANMNQTGFVDGFFLPQQNNAGTIGGSQQYALWSSYARPFATVTLDYVNDLQHRPAMPGYPADYVAFVTPQAILTVSKQFTPTLLVAIGSGRYAQRGTWATTPLDYGQNLAFFGAQYQESKHAALLVQLRESHFDGLPADPLIAQSPDFGSTLVIVEQRFHI